MLGCGPSGRPPSFRPAAPTGSDPARGVGAGPPKVGRGELGMPPALWCFPVVIDAAPPMRPASRASTIRKTPRSRRFRWLSPVPPAPVRPQYLPPTQLRSSPTSTRRSRSSRYRDATWTRPDPRPGRGVGPVSHRHPRRPWRLAGQALAAVHSRSRGRGDRRRARPRRHRGRARRPRRDAVARLRVRNLRLLRVGLGDAVLSPSRTWATRSTAPSASTRSPTPATSCKVPEASTRSTPRR